jgi:hypothetical protein
MMKDPKKLERYQRWRAVFGTQQGASVLTELKKMCGQNSSSAVQSVADGKIDPFYTLLKEGRRSVWLDIQNCMTEPKDMPKGENEGTD